MKKILLIKGCIIIAFLFPFIVKGQLTDVDGNSYKTVRIGSQLWMDENLRTTKYNDGSPVPLVTGPQWNDMTTPGYCWYNNNYKDFGKIYGALYNWYAISNKLCPSGWHVPDNNDWKILYDYLGGVVSAGGKLKEAGTSHWKEPNTGASDNSGFTALPGGGRWLIGRFDLLGRRGHWWSSSVIENDSEATILSLFYNESFIRQDTVLKGSGFSVRCVKN